MIAGDLINTFIRHLLFSYFITFKTHNIYEKEFNKTNVTYINRFIYVF